MQLADSFIADGVSKGLFPHVGPFVARRVVHHKAFACRNLGEKVPRKDEVFRAVFQMKVITSAALLILNEEGRLGLDDPLYGYIPSFKSPKGDAVGNRQF